MKIKPNDVFKYSLLFFIVVFISLFISQSTGYYAYSNYEKSVLTEDGIKMFEHDVAEGKQIDINNYIKKGNDYNNKLSSISLDISNKIGKYVRESIISVFKRLNRLIE